MYGGPESVKCKSAVDIVLLTAFTTLPASFVATPLNFFTIIRQIMTIPSQLKPILDSCLVGFSHEILQRIMRYVQGYPSMWEFFDTFSFNFGLLYDSVLNTMLDLIAKA